MALFAGYSGADMANLCREAAYGPVREAASSIQYIAASEVRKCVLTGTCNARQCNAMQGIHVFISTSCLW